MNNLQGVDQLLLIPHNTSTRASPTKLEGDAFKTNKGNFFPQTQVKLGNSLAVNTPSRGIQTDAKME